MKAWAVGVLVIAAVVVIGGAFVLLSPSTGALVVGVTDSPVNSNVTHIYLTISGVTFQGDGNSSVSYAINSTSFDLLALNNVTQFLGSNQVPVGNYTMVRFTVETATATISGSNVTLTVPSGEVKVPLHFQVQSGKTTTLVLDITADMTNISSSQNLRPVVTVKSVSGPS